MRFNEIIKSALQSIWSMKMRAFLTSLGVIIGVFAVASLLSVGQASVNELNNAMGELNPNLITSYFFAEGEELTMEELDAFSNSDSILAVAPISEDTRYIQNGIKTISTSAIYTTDSYMKAQNLDLIDGRFLLPIDIEKDNNVVVLGFTIAMKLFGNTNIMGEEVLINNMRYTVAGVLNIKAESWQGNANEQIIMPIDPDGNMDQFFVLATSSDDVAVATALLKNFFVDKLNSEEGFYVYAAGELQDTINDMNTTTMGLLGAIGGISLLISGIGIMNIMLVSVRERTKEIGIRKSIGAKRSDILKQFLIEAMVQTGIGGIIGVVLTYALATPIGALLDTTISPSVNIVMISLVFSLIIGIVFGIYPAAKASKLNPIEALRHE